MKSHQPKKRPLPAITRNPAYRRAIQSLNASLDSFRQLKEPEKDQFLFGNIPEPMPAPKPATDHQPPTTEPI